jgi:hypothetical protein
MLEHELVAAAAELPVAHLGVRVQPLWRERIARHVRECAAGGPGGCTAANDSYCRRSGDRRPARGRVLVFYGKPCRGAATQVRRG